MKLPCLAAFLVIASFTSLFAQSLDENPDHVISVALDTKSDAIYSGIALKQIIKMGDSAAVAIVKNIGDRVPGPAEVDRVLLVIEIAFRGPDGIQVEANRQPRAALFVLAYLEHSNISDKQKREIADLKRSLLKLRQ